MKGFLSRASSAAAAGHSRRALIGSFSSSSGGNDGGSGSGNGDGGGGSGSGNDRAAVLRANVEKLRYTYERVSETWPNTVLEMKAQIAFESAKHDLAEYEGVTSVTDDLASTVSDLAETLAGTAATEEQAAAVKAQLEAALKDIIDPK